MACGVSHSTMRNRRSHVRTVLIAVASGLMEPLGAVVGLGISTSFALGYPVALGLAAGAMIFVVSHEVIPETHRWPPNARDIGADAGVRGHDVSRYGIGLTALPVRTG